MRDVILTGASRGIGQALALALAPAPETRLILVARDASRLEEVARQVAARGGRAEVVPGDIGTLAGAEALGRRLTKLAAPGAVLVHNAGLWPSRRELTPEGFESAFVVNHLGPLALQRPLLEAGRLARILVVSAGLIDKGKVDPARTPTGEDFSAIGTYCSTKLCFAVAMRELARAHPEVDVLVLHPGVVRTDLGAAWVAAVAGQARLGVARDMRGPPGPHPAAPSLVASGRGELDARGERGTVARPHRRSGGAAGGEAGFRAQSPNEIVTVGWIRRDHPEVPWGPWPCWQSS